MENWDDVKKYHESLQGLSEDELIEEARKVKKKIHEGERMQGAIARSVPPDEVAAFCKAVECTRKRFEYLKGLK